jgi:tRNA(Met) cytidine acetyltransferase
VLSDSLADCDPDVVRATLRACDADVDLDLSAFGWRTVVAAANGPGLFDVAPAPFRDLAVKYFIDPGDAEAGSAGGSDGEPALSAREERLLVRRVLQGGSWERVATDLEFVSASACRRALGGAYATLVDAYAPAEALAERDRFRD